jgi:thiol-disulfide isomerase/thioredoxin
MPLLTVIRRLLVIALLSLAVSPQLASAHGIEIGKPAPDFKARTFDGRDIRLADFKGHVLIINLWATWCGPCRAELPLLSGYHRLQKDHGLDVIALATEDSVPMDKLKPLAAMCSFPFVRRMRGDYEIMKGVPTNYVIDRNGIVRYAEAGAFTLEALNELLVPLLREKPTEAAGPAP